MAKRITKMVLQEQLDAVRVENAILHRWKNELEDRVAQLQIDMQHIEQQHNSMWNNRVLFLGVVVALAISAGALADGFVGILK